MTFHGFIHQRPLAYQRHVRYYQTGTEPCLVHQTFKWPCLAQQPDVVPLLADQIGMEPGLARPIVTEPSVAQQHNTGPFLASKIAKGPSFITDPPVALQFNRQPMRRCMKMGGTKLDGPEGPMSQDWRRSYTRLNGL